MLLAVGISVFCLSLVYIMMLAYMYAGWKSTYELPAHIAAEYNDIKVSVILAIRNEEAGIEACIKSVLSNNYPSENYEIICVNDHSTDRTADILQSFALIKNVRVIHLSDDETGKKQAVTQGILQSSFDVILCTDADCKVPPDWIGQHARYHALFQPYILTGLVVPSDDGRLLSKFQITDFVATMCSTANGIFRKSYFLANGANLSYPKAFFHAVNGFEGNADLASGDDLFLMRKASETDTSKIHFLKSRESIVRTKPEQTWSAFLTQRKRWATKTIRVRDARVIQIQGFVFMYCLILLSLFPAGFVFSLPFVYIAMTGILIKMISDFIFLKKLLPYFDSKRVIGAFLPLFIMYFIHILYSGYNAMMPASYNWKERSVK